MSYNLNDVSDNTNNLVILSDGYTIQKLETASQATRANLRAEDSLSTISEYRYMEFEILTADLSSPAHMSVSVKESLPSSLVEGLAATYRSEGSIFAEGVAIGITESYPSYSVGDIIGLWVIHNGNSWEVNFSKNGVPVDANPTITTTGAISPVITLSGATIKNNVVGPFTYSPDIEGADFEPFVKVENLETKLLYTCPTEGLVNSDHFHQVANSTSNGNLIIAPGYPDTPETDNWLQCSGNGFNTELVLRPTNGTPRVMDIHCTMHISDDSSWQQSVDIMLLTDSSNSPMIEIRKGSTGGTDFEVRDNSTSTTIPNFALLTDTVNHIVYRLTAASSNSTSDGKIEIFLNGISMLSKTTDFSSSSVRRLGSNSIEVVRLSLGAHANKAQYRDIQVWDNVDPSIPPLKYRVDTLINPQFDSIESTYSTPITAASMSDRDDSSFADGGALGDTLILNHSADLIDATGPCVAQSVYVRATKTTLDPLTLKVEVSDGNNVNVENQEIGAVNNFTDYRINLTGSLSDRNTVSLNIENT